MNNFEKKFAEYKNCYYAIAMCNGTATLHSIIECVTADILNGAFDEIIVPALTMQSPALAALQAGCRPVFADCDPDTFLVTEETIEPLINNSTRAVVFVSLYGLDYFDSDYIKSLTDRGIVCIMDHAQSIQGHLYPDTIASYSFQSSKHLTCGEGGIVCIDDPDIALKIKRFSSLQYDSITLDDDINKNMIKHPDAVRHIDLGWNYRMSNILADHLEKEMENINAFIRWRAYNALSFLSIAKQYNFINAQSQSGLNSYWAFSFYLEGISFSDFKSKFMEYGGHNFYAAWRPLYQEPIAERYGLYGKCPVADKIQKTMCQLKTNIPANEIDKEFTAFEKTLKYFKAHKNKTNN